jgi:transcription antitermination factor NusG
MSAQWYALQSKPMKEGFLAEQLRLRDIESYFPSLRVQPVNPRARKLKPYFPGYVFGRIDLRQHRKDRLWLPGLAGMVCFDGIPSYIPDSLIDAIRHRVDQVNAAGGELLETLKPGDPITIQEGPFKGYEAILDARLSGEARVRILLTFLNRSQIPLELPQQHIQRTNQ